MRRTLLACSVFFLFVACPAEMWIPIQSVPRQRVDVEHVQYLEAAPDKPLDVIGIITPPVDEYDTEAQAINAMRQEAAKHGADAIFVESQTESSGWKFSSGFGGAKGGTFKGVAYAPRP